MLTAIIVDDEKQSCQTLENDLQLYCPVVKVIKVCTSGKEGILAIKKMNPDIVFTDIEMPWMNGFEMLEILGQINISIIFITAFNQFAAKAFRLSAIDYLLKPVDPADLQAAVSKVSQNINNSATLARLDNLLQNMKEPVARQKIALPCKDGYEFLEVSNIEYCQADGAYTKLFTEGKRTFLVSKTLGEFEELLPASIFHRIHHSTIVNMNYVTHFIKTDGGYLKMQNGEQLTVSKSKRESLLDRLRLNNH